MAIRRLKINDGDPVDIHDARILNIDQELDGNSTNPIQNKAVSIAVGGVNAQLANLGIEVTVLAAIMQRLTTNESIIAWDGTAAPREDDIPAGVEVEYNGTVYVGRLAASEDTVGYTYYVATGNGTWERYLSVKSGINYVWYDMGSTDVVLSEYERKDDNIWLTEEAFEVLSVKNPNKTYNIYEEVSEI